VPINETVYHFSIFAQFYSDKIVEILLKILKLISSDENSKFHIPYIP